MNVPGRVYLLSLWLTGCSLLTDLGHTPYLCVPNLSALWCFVSITTRREFLFLLSTAHLCHCLPNKYCLPPNKMAGSWVTAPVGIFRISPVFNIDWIKMWRTIFCMLLRFLGPDMYKNSQLLDRTSWEKP